MAFKFSNSVTVKLIFEFKRNKEKFYYIRVATSVNKTQTRKNKQGNMSAAARFRSVKSSTTTRRMRINNYSQRGTIRLSRLRLLIRRRSTRIKTWFMVTDEDLMGHTYPLDMRKTKCIPRPSEKSPTMSLKHTKMVGI